MCWPAGLLTPQSEPVGSVESTTLARIQLFETKDMKDHAVRSCLQLSENMPFWRTLENGSHAEKQHETVVCAG